ncbi:choline/ethanolamine kinase-like protein [Leptotrombidium deliense]|uniref:ethanolamine kinase n=1 Tax=Leptotrombidium deliense TaxID=299467 RepID=A0A443SGS8_9ACAR|nr:choline/ethanolamine kinase-like protein [Leptotrombidium deliense]
MEVGENTSKKLQQLCEDFLGDEWSGGLHIQKIECGVANQIYRCSPKVNKEIAVIVRMPANFSEEFAIKELDKESGGEFQMHSNAARIIICCVIADAGLAPELLGVFDEGRIEKYIAGRNMVIEDLNDFSFTSLIAKMMAKFHSLDCFLNQIIQKLSLIIENV